MQLHQGAVASGLQEVVRFAIRLHVPLACDRLLGACGRSDRWSSFPVGFKLTRHRSLQTILLILFLIVRGPGYGLHALVGIEHGKREASTSICCVFCVKQSESPDRGEAEPNAASTASQDLSPLVAKLTPTTAGGLRNAMVVALSISSLTLSSQKVYRCLIRHASHMESYGC